MLSSITRPSQPNSWSDATGRCNITMPTMQFAPLKQHMSVDRKVCNAAGKDIYNINVLGPNADFSRPEPGMPEEYVTISSFDHQEELSLWVMKARKGNTWECHCFREGEHLGYFSEDQSFDYSSLAEGRKFVLKTVRQSFRATKDILTVKGTLAKPPLLVMQQGVLAATVDPGYETRLGGHTYQVTCQPEANVGLVVLALLGMDRLLCHGSTPRASEEFQRA